MGEDNLISSKFEWKILKDADELQEKGTYKVLLQAIFSDRYGSEGSMWGPQTGEKQKEETNMLNDDFFSRTDYSMSAQIPRYYSVVKNTG